MVDNKEREKVEELSLSYGLTPSFHVMFYVICFFSTNEDVTKTSCLNKNISRKKVYGRPVPK